MGIELDIIYFSITDLIKENEEISWFIVHQVNFSTGFIYDSLPHLYHFINRKGRYLE
jgi:hypothetical protein